MASRDAHELRRGMAPDRRQQLSGYAAEGRAIASLPLPGTARLCAAHDAIASGGGYLGTVDLLDPIALLNQEKLE